MTPFCFLKGEPLETVQIAALMVQFIGEERTRYALNEDLKTVAIAKKMMADFNNLSKEEKFKAGIKLYVLLVTPPITIVKSAQAVNKVTGTVVAAIKKTQKNLVPEPDVFFKGATNLLKDSKNLSELSKKFKELPKPQKLNGNSKTFTQNYDLKSTSFPSGLKQKSVLLLSDKLTKQKLISYLEKIDRVPREQLIKDVESIGLKYSGGSPDGKIAKFTHKTKDYRVEIQDAHLKRKNGAKYEHIHIRDKNGNTLDKSLNVVDRGAPEAHIEIKALAKIIMENKPK